MQYINLHWFVEETDPRIKTDDPDVDNEEEIVFRCPAVLSPENALVLRRLQNYITDLLVSFSEEQKELHQLSKEPVEIIPDKKPLEYPPESFPKGWTPPVEKPVVAIVAPKPSKPVKARKSGGSPGSVGPKVKARALELLGKGFSVKEAHKRLCEEREKAGLPRFSEVNLYIWRKKMKTPPPPPKPAQPEEIKPGTILLIGNVCFRPNVDTISKKSCLDWQWRWRSGTAKPGEAIEHMKVCQACPSYMQSFRDLQSAANKKAEKPF
jgi:hypothetical protein